jgi:hypothetical protein
MSTPRKWGVAPAASLMKVFLPYLTYNTVFDNSRIVEAMGRRPEPFSTYAYPLLQFATKGHYTYPYKPWPEDAEARLSKVA